MVENDYRVQIFQTLAQKKSKYVVFIRQFVHLKIWRCNFAVSKGASTFRSASVFCISLTHEAISILHKKLTVNCNVTIKNWTETETKN